MQFRDSEELIAWVAQRCRDSGQEPRCLLSFSMGKDALAAWLALRGRIEVVPFYLYLVPGLEFVERSLAYYEGVLGQHIIRLPHPSLYRLWANLVFQAPQNCPAVEAAQLIPFEYEDVYRIIREDRGLPADTLTAVGVRATDSQQRGISIRQHGPVSFNKQTFFPVYDWPLRRVTDSIRRAGIRLPVDYRLFNRSFDGIDYRFLKPIRDHFPRDFARILECFPLADLELFRMECREAYHATR